MIIKKDHPHFDRTLDMVITFMQDKGTEISDIDAFKAEVLQIEVDDETNEISLKLAGDMEVEND